MLFERYLTGVKTEMENQEAAGHLKAEDKDQLGMIRELIQNTALTNALRIEVIDKIV